MAHISKAVSAISLLPNLEFLKGNVMKQSEITSTLAKSEAISNLAKSLIRAKKVIKSAVVKNAVNEMIGNSFADLGAVITAIESALLDAGIVVIQSPAESSSVGFVSLATMLLHESGEWMEGTCMSPLPQLDPQGFGSAITYLRRYSLTAMLGLHGVDDDGEGAKNEGQKADFKWPVPDRKNQPSGTAGPEVISPELTRDVTNFLNTVKKASLERMETARKTAQGKYVGDTLSLIVRAIDARELELKPQ
jgi:hypothetical protein